MKKIGAFLLINILLALFFVSAPLPKSDRVLIGSPATQGYITKWQNATTIDNSVMFQSGNNIGIGTTNPHALLDVRGSAIFNDDGSDSDFRIETESDQNTFFVDGSLDRVGIGTSTPITKLDVVGDLAVSLTANVASKLRVGPFFIKSPQFSLVPGSETTVGQITRGAIGQTADLTQWQESSGTTGLYVTSAGNDICITGGNCLSSFKGMNDCILSTGIGGSSCQIFNTNVNAQSRVHCFAQDTMGGIPGTLYISEKVAGSHYIVSSTSLTDVSSVNCIMF
ncbi:MAG: hypothetical protein RL557_216 [archaeon]|jgi:hypothetical protein